MTKFFRTREDAGRNRRLRQLLGELSQSPRALPLRPAAGATTETGAFGNFAAPRRTRRAPRSDSRATRGVDLAELRLQHVFDRLGLDTMAPRTFSCWSIRPRKIHAAAAPDVDPTFVAGAVEAGPNCGCVMNFFAVCLRQITIAAGDMDAADAKLADLPVRQRRERIDLQK